MSVAGRLTPALAFAIAGSFHFVILPRKMSASTGPVNWRSLFTPGVVEPGPTAPRPAGRRRRLLVGQRPVGGAEEDGARRDLSDPGARAERLVVDLDVGVELVVFRE